MPIQGGEYPITTNYVNEGILHFIRCCNKVIMSWVNGNLRSRCRNPVA